MELSAILDIKPGVTAIIGGGGKTTLMFTLADELKSAGTVIVCTSTRIWIPEHIPVLCGTDETVLRDVLRDAPVVCVGVNAGEGKLKAPTCSFERLAELAQYVLVEADGSNGLPMKAHAPDEPVIPDAAEQTILVIGASGFGRTIHDAAHRPALYAKLADSEESSIITPERAVRVVLAERLHDRVFVNQVESERLFEAAKTLKSLLNCPVCVGSLHSGEFLTL